MTVMRERGVAEMTLDEVQSAADVGRSQMYHYFDGREDLIRAVVDATVDAVLGGSVEELAGLSSLDGIDRWFERAENACGESGGLGGCPLGSLVGQIAEHDDVARCSLADGFDRWATSLAVGFAHLRDEGVLAADVDERELADFTMATLQGGLLLAQVSRDPIRLRHALDGARATLRAAQIR